MLSGRAGTPLRDTMNFFFFLSCIFARGVGVNAVVSRRVVAGFGYIRQAALAFLFLLCDSSFLFLSVSNTIDRRGLVFVSRERNGRGGNEGDKRDDQPSALANG